MSPPEHSTFLDSLKSTYRKAFYERHIGVAIAMIVVLFLAPFLGLIFNGLRGAMLGMGGSIAAYYLAPYTVQILRR